MAPRDGAMSKGTQMGPQTLLKILLPLLQLACVLPLARGHDWWPRISVPIRPDHLPDVPRVRVGPSGEVPVVLEPANIEIFLDASTYVRFTNGRYAIPGASSPTSLVTPAIVIDAVCDSFSIALTNKLPFQPWDTCPAVPTNVINGPKDLDWTNLHTHGLKADPGATAVENICEPGFSQSGFPLPASPSDLQQYYCNETTSSQQLCAVFGDDNLVTGRPLVDNPTSAIGGGWPMVGQVPGATLRYTYPLKQGLVPGTGWYHPHLHGSVAAQTETAAGPWMIPESWLPGGLDTLYKPVRGPVGNPECKRLIKVLERMPLESSTVLQIQGVFFRTDATGAPDDDTLPFLGANAVPPSILLYENGNTSRPLFDNQAQRDWGLVNGAFQPTIRLEEATYDRWQIVNSMTMKWLDLTFQKVESDGSLTPVDSCKIWLLGRDAVPLPFIPRVLRSEVPGLSPANDLLMGSGSRADVLVKCNMPGTYVLASAAGPFHTNPDACRATHCECFGDPPVNGAPLRPANNLYNGFELNAAVLATIKVEPLTRTKCNNGVGNGNNKKKNDYKKNGRKQRTLLTNGHQHDGGKKKCAEEDFPSDVCRTKLEQFYYLDTPSFPKQPTVEQCFSFMNIAFGGGCSVNNILFPNLTFRIDQGSTQKWHLRDTTFHPFHLHETPVQLTGLPTCFTNVTNNHKLMDWVDVLQLPPCQTGCPWSTTASGPGTCGGAVVPCDEASITFLGTNFANPLSSFPPGRTDLCAPYGRRMGWPTKETVAAPSTDCDPRVSLVHCHVLSHEDEGCMAVLEWPCPCTPSAGAPGQQCPTSYPPCPS